MIERFSYYKKIILTVLIILFCFLLIFGIINGSIADFMNKLWKILSPVTIGFVIAYLSNPLVNFFEKRIFSFIQNFKIRRFFSILITILLILLFISIIIVILVPSLINTLLSFWETYVVNYRDSIRRLANTLNSVMDRFKIERINPDSTITWIEAKLPWITNVAKGDLAGLLPDVSSSISHNISAIFNYALSFGASLFNLVQNIFLGVFIAFYILMSKERIKAYIRRFLNSFLSPKNVRTIVRFGKLLDRSFGGFIEGQLLDALIVGILSYLTFLIFGLPIPHLLATIIALTNIIPILGPFIGGIPAAFLVLLTAPEKTILFIILIIIIQQIDGNIICPNILGDKINISSLATLIAIITMGGLFGIFGMLIGVPIFAVIIHIINDYTMNALRKKGLQTSLKDYYVGNPQNIEPQKVSLSSKFKSLFTKTKSNNKMDKNTNNQEK